MYHETKVNIISFVVLTVDDILFASKMQTHLSLLEKGKVEVNVCQKSALNKNVYDGAGNPSTN